MISSYNLFTLSKSSSIIILNCNAIGIVIKLGKERKHILYFHQRLKKTQYLFNLKISVQPGKTLEIEVFCFSSTTLMWLTKGLNNFK